MDYRHFDFGPQYQLEAVKHFDAQGNEIQHGMYLVEVTSRSNVRRTVCGIACRVGVYGQEKLLFGAHRDGRALRLGENDLRFDEVLGIIAGGLNYAQEQNNVEMVADQYTERMVAPANKHYVSTLRKICCSPRQERESDGFDMPGR
ncbi:MAG: hypothetical protein H6922_00805 [Pseudomonadaceae bacterium]|nr:hypothetical protein [Pseudomonadaceae bacterium]